MSKHLSSDGHDRIFLRTYTDHERRAFVAPECPHCRQLRPEPRWRDISDRDAASVRRWALDNIECRACGQRYIEPA